MVIVNFDDISIYGDTDDFPTPFDTGTETYWWSQTFYMSFKGQPQTLVQRQQIQQFGARGTANRRNAHGDLGGASSSARITQQGRRRTGCS